MNTGILLQKKVILPVVSLLVLVRGVWAVVGTRDHTPSVPKEFRPESLKAVANQDPRQMFERAREAMNDPKLTEEQRHQIWENMHQVREEQENRRLDEYFAAPETQRVAILDRDIDEMLPRMREMEKRRAEWQRTLATNPAAEPPWGRFGPRDRRPGEQGVRGGAGGGTQAAAGQGNAAGPQQQAQRPSPTREQRKARSESRSPDQGARRMTYMTALRKRAEQRGIQMPRFGPPGGGHP